MTDYKIEKFRFDQESVNIWGKADPVGVNWPVVYTLSNNKQIYVGETLNATSRLTQHLASSSKKDLNQVQIILNSKFNKSVCLDLESHLIRYFAADGTHQVLNANAGITDANYFDRDQYRKSFAELFEQLVAEGLLSRSVPEIINSNLFKFSPFKALTNEQAIVVSGIIERLLEELASGSNKRLIVQGDPGTGKTIVAIYLAKLLKDIAVATRDEISEQDSVFSEFFTPESAAMVGELKIGLVVPQQALRKTLVEVFKQTPGLDKSMVLSPFDVGTSDQNFDLLIVDEAHRLGQRANQSSPMQNARFSNINKKLFGTDDNQFTQLDWIEKKSRIQLLLIDTAQSIKPADLPLEKTNQLLEEASRNSSLFKLATQMRVMGGEKYLDYVRALLSPHPEVATGIEEYDLRFYDDFRQMRIDIETLDDEIGLCRMLAGFAWPWKSKRDSTAIDIEIQGEKLQWNQTQTDWVNSATSSREVGSIHTIQGYDLNYAGVIIGNDIAFDATSQRIVLNRGNYFDVKGKEKNSFLGVEYSDEDVLHLVLNIYKVLLTRGIRGTFVYVCDPALREHLRGFFPSNRSF